MPGPQKKIAERQVILMTLPWLAGVYGPVAQRLEQGTHNPLVVGSNPTGPTFAAMRLCTKGFSPFTAFDVC